MDGWFINFAFKKHIFKYKADFLCNMDYEKLLKKARKELPESTLKSETVEKSSLSM